MSASPRIAPGQPIEVARAPIMTSMTSEEIGSRNPFHAMANYGLAMPERVIRLTITY
jgi:hypothetical protein